MPGGRLSQPPRAAWTSRMPVGRLSQPPRAAWASCVSGGRLSQSPRAAWASCVSGGRLSQSPRAAWASRMPGGRLSQPPRAACRVDELRVGTASLTFGGIEASKGTRNSLRLGQPPSQIQIPYPVSQIPYPKSVSQIPNPYLKSVSQIRHFRHRRPRPTLPRSGAQTERPARRAYARRLRRHLRR